MFKKFTAAESIATSSQAKTSVSRNIKKSIVAAYGEHFEAYLEELIPKKGSLYIVKCHGHVQLAVCQGQVLFWQADDTQWLPTLRILHKFPDLLPKVRVDRGAIKFVLKGADIMAPGLTSAGGHLPAADQVLPASTCVCIEAEGKEHALAIGQLKMSSEEIKQVNKGTAIQNLHFLNDGLWNIGALESK